MQPCGVVDRLVVVGIASQTKLGSQGSPRQISCSFVVYTYVYIYVYNIYIYIYINECVCVLGGGGSGGFRV